MNEWVKRIRSSVQSVVDGKRRKSAASPATADRKHNTATGRPHTVAPELELPPVEPPQLPGLTKQRARGPPRRRPSPRTSQYSSSEQRTSQHSSSDQQRTVSCPPADSDPARFAWGRDPSIDPALFFSDVVGRSMGDARSSNGSVWAADRRLGSIAESDGGSEGSQEVVDRTKNGSGSDMARRSEGSNRLSEDAQRVSTGSGADIRDKDVGSEPGEEQSDNAKRASGDGEEGQSDTAKRASGDGEEGQSDNAKRASGDGEEGQSDAAKRASGDGEETARKSDSAVGGSERPASGASEGRESPVLRLTGGEVAGAPRRRLCTIL